MCWRIYPNTHTPSNDVLLFIRKLSKFTLILMVCEKKSFDVLNSVNLVLPDQGDLGFTF